MHKLAHELVAVSIFGSLFVTTFIGGLLAGGTAMQLGMWAASGGYDGQAAALPVAFMNEGEHGMQGSSTMPRPSMDGHMASGTLPGSMASGTPPMAGHIDGKFATSCAPLIIARTLLRGSHGDDVSNLQTQLMQQGLLASSSVTGFFGALTEKAVGQWQQQQGIASSSQPSSDTGVGMVGPRTRALFAKCEGAVGKMFSNGIKGDMRDASSTPKGFDDHGSSTQPKSDHEHPGNLPNSNPQASSTSGVSVQVVSPNGGENYHAGSGDTLTVSWTASGVPDGSKACVFLVASKNKRFLFPHTDNACVTVTNGSGSVSGPLVLTKDYVLTAGSYEAEVVILPSSGTPGGILAQDSSDASFTLDDEDLGYSDNASNSASVLEAVSEIGHGYGQLFNALASLIGF